MTLPPSWFCPAETKLSRKQQKELKALVALRVSQVDLSDQPEVRDWSRAVVVGKLYRPIKKSLTMPVRLMDIK